MKERIIQLRKELKLSQSSFADKIDISRNFVGLVECGERNLSDRTIKDICEVFNVNEDWLRNGTGEMFNKRTRTEELFSFYNSITNLEDSSFKKRFFVALSKLDESDWETLMKIADSLKED